MKANKDVRYPKCRIFPILSPIAERTRDVIDISVKSGRLLNKAFPDHLLDCLVDGYRSAGILAQMALPFTNLSDNIPVNFFEIKPMILSNSSLRSILHSSPGRHFDEEKLRERLKAGTGGSGQHVSHTRAVAGQEGKTAHTF